MSPRILLLRLFVASWAIPVAWLVFFPLFYLVSGNARATAVELRGLCAELWNGEL